jgi:hypothetical protein
MTFLTLLAMAVAAVLGIGLAVVGLVEAPWQVLLVGLFAALYGLERRVFAGEVPPIEGMPAPPAAESRAPSRPPAEADLVGAIAASNSAPAAIDSGSADPAAKGNELIYRGIRYRQQQATDDLKEAARAAAEGIYRGQRWRR